MFIKRKYKNRHLILKTLQEYFDRKDRSDKIDLSEVQLSFRELVTKSTLTETEVIEQLDYLQKQDEINIEIENFSAYYIILRNGTISFYDKKYLSIGKREFLSDTYDILKNISTIILLLIAIITFVANFIDTRRNKEKIEKLNFELKQLKESLNNPKIRN